MALEAPNQADQAKLHAEVNQYINQRFTIAMTAIATFGVVTGWLASGVSTAQPKVQPVTFLIAAVLLVVLMLLFVYSRVISGSLESVTSYLVITKASPWELAYRKFHPVKPKFVSQDDSQCLLFLILGALGGAAPIVLLALIPVEGGWRLVAAMAVLFVVWVAYLCIIWLAWSDRCFNFAKGVDAIWEKIAQPNAAPETGRTAPPGGS